MLNGLIVPAIMINQRGLIQCFNPAAEKVWGYKFTDIMGKNVKLLMPKNVAEKHQQYIEQYLKTGVGKVN